MVRILQRQHSTMYTICIIIYNIDIYSETQHCVAVHITGKYTCMSLLLLLLVLSTVNLLLNCSLIHYLISLSLTLLNNVKPLELHSR